MNLRLGLRLFGALEPDNQGNFQIQFLCGLDDTFSNVITSHDTYLIFNASERNK